MIESDIRIEDTRHTLPNLKTLLLTISSRRTPSTRGTPRARDARRETDGKEGDDSSASGSVTGLGA